MGVVRATWCILEFHTPWNISRVSGVAEATVVQFLCACRLCQMLAFGWLTIPESSVARVTWSILEFYTPSISLEWLKIESPNFVHGLVREVLVLWLQIVTQVGVVKVMWRLNFWGNNRKRCKTDIYLQWKTNRKSYMAYQMAATAATLNDLEGHSPVAGLFKCNPSNICASFYTISNDSVLAVPLR